MSTRAQIKIKGNPIHIYKHSDGYPEGVMPTLEPIVERFAQERGLEDHEYLLANIMRAFARKEERRRKANIEDYKKPANAGSKPAQNMIDIYSKPSLTGFGIGLDRHGDIEFLYEIDTENKQIIVNDIRQTTNSYMVNIDTGREE